MIELKTDIDIKSGMFISIDNVGGVGVVPGIDKGGVVGIAARDLSAGETICLNMSRNTDDIMIRSRKADRAALGLPNSSAEIVTCPMCDGFGLLTDSIRCLTCDGEGEIPADYRRKLIDYARIAIQGNHNVKSQGD